MQEPVYFRFVKEETEFSDLYKLITDNISPVENNGKSE